MLDVRTVSHSLRTSAGRAPIFCHALRETTGWSEDKLYGERVKTSALANAAERELRTHVRPGRRALTWTAVLAHIASEQRELFDTPDARNAFDALRRDQQSGPVFAQLSALAKSSTPTLASLLPYATLSHDAARGAVSRLRHARSMLYKKLGLLALAPLAISSAVYVTRDSLSAHRASTGSDSEDFSTVDSERAAQKEEIAAEHAAQAAREKEIVAARDAFIRLLRRHIVEEPAPKQKAETPRKLPPNAVLLEVEGGNSAMGYGKYSDTTASRAVLETVLEHPELSSIGLSFTIAVEGEYRIWFRAKAREQSTFEASLSGDPPIKQTIVALPSRAWNASDSTAHLRPGSYALEILNGPGRIRFDQVLITSATDGIPRDEDINPSLVPN